MERSTIFKWEDWKTHELESWPIFNSYAKLPEGIFADFQTPGYGEFTNEGTVHSVC